MPDLIHQCAGGNPHERSRRGIGFVPEQGQPVLTGQRLRFCLCGYGRLGRPWLMAGLMGSPCSSAWMAGCQQLREKLNSSGHGFAGHHHGIGRQRPAGSCPQAASGPSAPLPRRASGGEPPGRSSYTPRIRAKETMTAAARALKSRRALGAACKGSQWRMVPGKQTSHPGPYESGPPRCPGVVAGNTAWSGKASWKPLFRSEPRGSHPNR